MGKIKSAVITAILVAAIVVLALFATISCTVPGSNGVKRYNSFVSSIHLGADLTGNAYTVLYPDGVISAADYVFGIPDADEDEEKYNEYVERYASYGSVYIDGEVYDNADAVAELKENVKKDASVLTSRFGAMGYTSYSVSVQDDYTIKVTVPTNFTYSAYKEYDQTAYSEETARIENTITRLTYSGELSLRDADGKTLTPIKDDVTTYFNGFKYYAIGGSYAIKVNLTSTGKDKIAAIVANSSEDDAIGFYVGDDQAISLTVDSSMGSGKSFYISGSDSDYARDFAVILDSVASGQILSVEYGSDFEVVYATSALGENAAIFLAVALLLVVLAVIVASVVKYKKLGLVNAIIVLMYALTIIIALMLLEIQLTLAGAITAALGLALLTGSNFALFEAVRKETKKGKTMPASVKSGYKSIFSTILDLHIILVVASIIVALVCVGELAACGFIFFIATVASYILYWFTRLMWYVISSPVRDKFAFGGYKREVVE